MAVLSYNPQSIERYDELKNFLNDDKDDVKREKGGGAFTVVEQEDDEEDAGMMNMDLMMMMGGGGMMRRQKPPRIYFFRNRGDGRVKTADADETVTLNGWKREDITDMLMTVLP